MQIQAQGDGSAGEVVVRAWALKIDLRGAMNADPGYLARVRPLAASSGVPVQFYPATEQHGIWLHTPVRRSGDRWQGRRLWPGRVSRTPARAAPLRRQPADPAVG